MIHFCDVLLKLKPLRRVRLDEVPRVLMVLHSLQEVGDAHGEKLSRLGLASHCLSVDTAPACIIVSNHHAWVQNTSDSCIGEPLFLLRIELVKPFSDLIRPGERSVLKLLIIINLPIDNLIELSLVNNVDVGALIALAVHDLATVESLLLEVVVELRHSRPRPLREVRAALEEVN